jgi:hypothetical protein
VSLRSSLWRYLGLLAVAALAVGAFAGPASAKKMSAKQRAAVRAQLKKEVKKNPRVVQKKSFLKRASLVNFKLPVTLALRGGSTATNPNKATIDLGASLGQREVDLGGSLSAELTFHDSYDGGALGNVDLSILPSANHSLTSTSIPLLWNTQVSQPGSRYDANSVGLPSALSGCAGFTGTAALPFGADNASPAIPLFGAGLPGFPYFANTTDAQSWSTSHNPALVSGYLPEKPGIDGTDKLATAKNPGNNDVIGGATDPFPQAGASTPPDVDGRRATRPQLTPCSVRAR